MSPLSALKILTGFRETGGMDSDAKPAEDLVARVREMFQGTVMARPKRLRPGTSFKNGKLYVFSDRRIIVLRPWPNLMAWTKTLARPKWQPMRPVVRCDASEPGSSYIHDCISRWDAVWGHGVAEDPGPETVPDDDLPDEEPDPEMEAFLRKQEKREAKEREARGRFFETIPHPIRALVQCFPRRQWHLLSMLARCPGAADLVVSNPALAFCLASNWVFHRPTVQRPLRAARALLRHKQRYIAEWLGFPGTEAAVRVLRKVQPEACEVSPLLRLRELMRKPKILRHLGHFPPLDHLGLRLVACPKPYGWATPALLTEVQVDSQTVIRCGRLLEDMLEMRQLLGEARPPHPLRSMKQLQGLHDDLMTRLNRAKIPWKVSPPFPPPPLPGTAEIVPLVSAKDLAEEGWQQRNCVAAYASRVRRGCCYIYRVLAPERATLALFLRKDGWRLGELEARSNRDVSQDTELLVKAWLAQSTPRKVTSPTSGTSCRTRRPSNEWSAPTEAQAA